MFLQKKLVLTRFLYYIYNITLLNIGFKHMIIKLTEQQYKWLSGAKDIIEEGVDWSKNDDGTINFSINHKTDNNSNKGANSVDTRVFGTKDDILNGKVLTKTGKESQNSKSLSQNYVSKKAAIEFYQNVIQYVQNGRIGDLKPTEGLDSMTYTAVKKWFENNYSDNRIIDACKKSINRISSDASQVFSTHDRVSNEPNSDKVARYITGTVPSTNVKYISLFSMTDFNFSDAIKHGTVRQNGNTDKILGITDTERETDERGNLKTIDVTYDGKFKPNIAQNFSLNNVKAGHFKQNYGLNGEGGYNSVTAFLDKSIMYADYALKKEGFRPDVLVSAPSSSDFNKYYCTNLSNKLGIPYFNDFFSRNVVNVKFDNGKDISIMKEKGFSDKEIMEFAAQVKGIAYKEIAYFISEPIRKFVNDNINYFNNIPIEKSSRQKMPIEYIINCISNHTYQMCLQSIQNNDTMTKHLLQNFFKEETKLKTSRYNYSYLLSQIQQRISQRMINNILQQVLSLIQQYSQQLQSNGYKLRFDTKRFKITQIKKQFRPFLNNVYIVADKYINQNGELFNRYKNAKFVIFDEDINSGATLKLVIDALKEKLPENTDNNILCLVNAYSGSGF